MKKFNKLIQNYLTEAESIFSDWIFFEVMKELVSASENMAFVEIPESDFHMTSISQQASLDLLPFRVDNDPDRDFLLQLLPEIKQLDQKTKAHFKLQVHFLVHNLRYNDAENFFD